MYSARHCCFRAWAAWIVFFGCVAFGCMYQQLLAYGINKLIERRKNDFWKFCMQEPLIIDSGGHRLGIGSGEKSSWNRVLARIGFYRKKKSTDSQESLPTRHIWTTVNTSVSRRSAWVQTQSVQSTASSPVEGSTKGTHCWPCPDLSNSLIECSNPIF